MTYQPTDAAIEAGAKVLHDQYRARVAMDVPEWERLLASWVKDYRDEAAALLIAARAAEPMPTMAEFEKVATNYGAKCFTFGMQGHSLPEIGDEVEAAKDALRSLFRRATGEGVGE